MITDLAASAKKRVKEWFDTPLHCLLTLIMALLFWKAGIPFLKWAIVNATWGPVLDGPAHKSGANWGFVRENLRFILLRKKGMNPR